MKTTRRLVLISFILSLPLLTTACTITPWVKPYERQNLADPIMAFDRDPVAVRYLNHVYEAREAMRGAEGSSGGGCGCN
jgi:hypothetical protein